MGFYALPMLEEKKLVTFSIDGAIFIAPLLTRSKWFSFGNFNRCLWLKGLTRKDMEH